MHHYSRTNTSARAIELRARARRHRFAPTESEFAFWQLVKAKQIGVTVRRQVLVGPYIADFCCARLKLVVEIDGGVHQHTVQGDRHRDKLLSAAGYAVLRLPAELVLKQPEIAQRRVREAVAAVWR